jgi:two-component system CheB/CheR fusion protein
LAQELEATKQYLQSIIERYETANEELKSANEEILSSNEELQSTNEELETAKEELQSTNEELSTLNEELHNRLVELNVRTDDLHNILGAVSSAVVLVDSKLRIRRFSAAAERLLNLVVGDMGRSIAYVRTVVNARDIEQTIANAMQSVTATEQRVRVADGNWYTMRITPYRTGDHAIRGAIVELVRIGAGKEQRHPGVRDLGGLAGSILASLSQGLALLDDRLRIAWGNARFLDLFGVEADAFGRPFEDLWGGKGEHPELWKRLEEAVHEGRPLERFTTVAPFGPPLDRPLQVSAQRLPADGDRPRWTLVVVEHDEDQEHVDGR